MHIQASLDWPLACEYRSLETDWGSQKERPIVVAVIMVCVITVIALLCLSSGFSETRSGK